MLICTECNLINAIAVESPNLQLVLRCRAAVKWVEEYLANQENKKPKNMLEKRDRAIVNRLQSCLHLSSSFLSASSFLNVESANESPSDLGTSTKESSRSLTYVHCIAAFSAGVIFCLAATQSRK